MKTTLSAIILAATLVLCACGNSSKGSATVNDSTATAGDTSTSASAGEYDSKAWPWDFPQEVKLNAKAGQKVLAYLNYELDVKDGDDMLTGTAQFYLGTVAKVGEAKSVIKSDNINKEFEVPNALVVPLPENQQAKVGDIVLGYWEKGQKELTPCIVTEASDPASPVVTCLSGAIKSNGSIKIPDYKKGNKLVANAFTVLQEDKWMPGMPIEVKNDDGKETTNAIIVGIDGDKILALKGGRNLRAYKRPDCKLLSVKSDFKVGDKVKALWAFNFSDGFTVKTADAKNGFYLVEKGNLSAVVSVLEMIKE